MIALPILLAASVASLSPSSDVDYVGRTFVAACMDATLQIDQQILGRASWDDLSPEARERYAAYRFQDIFRFNAKPNTFLLIYKADPGTKGFTNICALTSSDFSLSVLWEAITKAQGNSNAVKGPSMNFIYTNENSGYIYAGNEFDRRNRFVEVLHLNNDQLNCLKTGGPGVDVYLAFTPEVFSGERLAGCP
jgi:hypothetical protein